MKILVDRSILLKSLSHVQNVVEKRSSIAVLSNVKIDALGDVVFLNATDMDIDIVENITAEILEKGTMTAPAHTLYDIVRKLPDGSQIELTHSLETGQLTLKSGRSRFSLSCLPVEDFPVISGGNLPYHFKLPTEDLKSLLNRTRFAMSNEETRYYLNGIYIHPAVSDGKSVLRSAATDGHRLARAEITAPLGVEEMPGIILPKKTVGELGKLLDENIAEVDIWVSDLKIRFCFGNITLTSKLIDGTFPDYERVIPLGNDKFLDIECKSFMAAVDRVSAINTDKSSAVKLTLSLNIITLSLSNPESGSAVEEIEVFYDGPLIEIGFNAKYLLDALSQIQGTIARFALADSASPTIVTELEDQSGVYVLMPMRV